MRDPLLSVALALGVLLLTSTAGCADRPVEDSPEPAAPEVVAPFERFVELEPTPDEAANAAVGDLDGDGNLDIVLVKGRHAPFMSRVFMGDGTGAFPNSHNLTDEPFRSYSGSLADLDGDGVLDVVLSNDAPDPKVILFGEGDGRFREGGSYGDPAWTTRNAAVADFNGDGHPDIVVANRGVGVQQYVCLNHGDGSFDDACTPFAEYGATTITPADVDGDGSIDLVVPSRDFTQTFVFMNSGDASFPLAARVPVGLPGAAARAAGVGDFDEDGFQDIVLIDEVRRTAEVHYGQPGGYGLPSIVASGLAAPYALFVGDVNADGHADVLVGYVQSPSTAFFGDGAGAFTRLEFGDGEGVAYGFAVADLDKDGHPDIVAARSGGTSVVYFGAAGDVVGR